MTRSFSLVRVANMLLVLFALTAFVGCPSQTATTPAGDESDNGEASVKTELLIELPEKYNTPDGMCLLPDGNVIVSIPNVNDQENGSDPVLLKIKPDNTWEVFYECQPHPKTGKAFPFGVCCDEKGDIYLTDLQWFADTENPDHNSRILWIPVKDGKPGEAKSIAQGMVVANAVLVRDGYMYVSDTTMVPDSKPLLTGVYRFKLDEIKENPVTLTQPLEKDPHTIAVIETHNPDVGFGADGLTMDSKGNLYIGNFADGTVHKVSFDEQGNPSKPEIFGKAPFMKSADGVFCDLATDKIYVADSLANAVQVISPDGTVETLVVDPEESDGLNGRLDQPCEVLIRGDEMLISNFDMPTPGGVNTKFETPNTIVCLKLPKAE